MVALVNFFVFLLFATGFMTDCCDFDKVLNEIQTMSIKPLEKQQAHLFQPFQRLIPYEQPYPQLFLDNLKFITTVESLCTNECMLYSAGTTNNINPKFMTRYVRRHIWKDEKLRKLFPQELRQYSVILPNKKLLGLYKDGVKILSIEEMEEHMINLIKESPKMSQQIWSRVEKQRGNAIIEVHPDIERMLGHQI